MNLSQLLGTKKGSLIQLVVGLSVDIAFRYLVFAGVAWLLGYVLFKQRWALRKIIPRFPTSQEVWREIRYSALTFVIFGLVGALTIEAGRHGWTQLYWKLNAHSAAWFWTSVCLSILLHDTYFYWTHRLMHHRWLFKSFHRVHHLSTNPSPWAAYSFAPLEAVVEASIFPLVTVVMPIHPLAFTLVMLWQIAFNVSGHAGYEFYPRWLMKSGLGWIINTPTNHIMHHEKMRGNYGLYFNVWDRLMKTNHPDYEQRFHEVTSRSVAS
jgi:sterol desaturase/sphingolipid hydroxylase (fatty acid hydroxylase superfamily)